MTGFVQALIGTFGWPAAVARPDEWTADRVDRAVALALCGSVEEAQLIYRQTVGQEFAAYLLSNGQIGRGDEVMRGSAHGIDGVFDVLLDDQDRPPCDAPDACSACRLLSRPSEGETWRAWYARMQEAEATP